jgi:putative FmdB family regulatory protein
MPIYEYECSECGISFEKLQRFGDPQPETCPAGHKHVHRRFSQPAIIFKGSGFYVTDNGRNGRSGSSTGKGKTKQEKDTASSTSETLNKDTK